MSATDVFSDIEASLETLAQHPVFCGIRTVDDLALFMSWHVFTVWDFMSLIKRLQREFTCTRLPWTPPRHPLAARLINDIVRDEESDVTPDGVCLSHFELYLRAMKEVGACTTQIEKYIALLEEGLPVKKALKKASAPACVQTFVNHTMTTVEHGDIYQVLGSFFFGREHVIPGMFKGLLDNWGLDVKDAPMFVFYLNRHIELDGDNHGPAALRLISDITQDNRDALQQVKASATEALQARIDLLDGLAQAQSMKLSA
jgi:hypothetical protein